MKFFYIFFLLLFLFSQVNYLSAQIDTSLYLTLTNQAIANQLDSLYKAKELLTRQIEKDSIIKSILSDSDIKEFNFVGGGDLNSIAQNGDNKTAGNISLGLHYIRDFPKNKLIKDLEMDFGVNVSSTVDSFSVSDERSFGNYILNPINSRQSARLDLYSLFKPIFHKDSNGKETEKEKWYSILFDGVFFRFYGSNSQWNFNGQMTHVTALHWKFGLFHELIPDKISRTSNTSIMIGAAIGQRAITGDIKDDLSDFMTLYGTKKTSYWGADLVFSIKFNNIRAEFLIPFLWKDGLNSIRGLTDTQFITQVRFVGGFPLGLNNSKQIADKVAALK